MLTENCSLMIKLLPDLKEKTPRMKRFLTSLLMFVMVLSMGLVSINAQNRDDDDDADIPPISRGKIDKSTYLRLRAEHIEKLRGLDKANRDKQKESRARALKSLEQQEQQKQKERTNQQGTATTTTATPSADATMSATDTSLVTASAVTTAWTPIGPAPITNGQTFLDADYGRCAFARHRRYRH